MTKPERLYEQLLASTSRTTSFRDFERLVEAFGFTLKRTRGSHRQYTHPKVPAVLTINPDKALPGQAPAWTCRGIWANARRVNEPHYPINLFWSDEDGVWIAEVPDLRGCMTHGPTRAEAVANAAEAIEGWLEVARECDIPIPAPSYPRETRAA
ncbi:MAG: type II toxin-antitoxin system HicA family toxin [Sphingomicrobium sp.]